MPDNRYLDIGDLVHAIYNSYDGLMGNILSRGKITPVNAENTNTRKVKDGNKSYNVTIENINNINKFQSDDIRLGESKIIHSEHRSHFYTAVHDPATKTAHIIDSSYIPKEADNIKLLYGEGASTKELIIKNEYDLLEERFKAEGIENVNRITNLYNNNNDNCAIFSIINRELAEYAIKLKNENGMINANLEYLLSQNENGVIISDLAENTLRPQMKVLENVYKEKNHLITHGQKLSNTDFNTKKQKLDTLENTIRSNIENKFKSTISRCKNNIATTLNNVKQQQERPALQAQPQRVATQNSIQPSVATASNAIKSNSQAMNLTLRRVSHQATSQPATLPKKVVQRSSRDLVLHKANTSQVEPKALMPYNGGVKKDDFSLTMEVRKLFSLVDIHRNMNGRVAMQGMKNLIKENFHIEQEGKELDAFLQKATDLIFKNVAKNYKNAFDYNPNWIPNNMLELSSKRLAITYPDASTKATNSATQNQVQINSNQLQLELPKEFISKDDLKRELQNAMQIGSKKNMIAPSLALPQLTYTPGSAGNISNMTTHDTTLQPRISDGVAGKPPRCSKNNIRRNNELHHTPIAITVR